MYSSLNQRFACAGFQSNFGDSERKVSRKPNSLDCSVTITNDVYGPPPSAIRAKLQAERRNAAVTTKSRPTQSAHGNHTSLGTRFSSDLAHPGGPPNKGRVPQQNEWSDRANGNEFFARGRTRAGPVPVAGRSRGGIYHEAVIPTSPDAFRGRTRNPLTSNFPVGIDVLGVGNGRVSTSRRPAPTRRGNSGRLNNSRHAHWTVGSSRLDYGPPSSQMNGKYSRTNFNSTAYGDVSWDPGFNRFTRGAHRGGKPDWFGRPSKSRGSGQMTNGHSSAWMHDDRVGPRSYKTAPTNSGNRFGKRPTFDRKFDARNFVTTFGNVPATDEYIDDFNPEDLVKYKLDINMDNFTVRSPLSSDPILRTPLSKWGSDELRYSPDRDLFALHTPFLLDSDDGDDLAWALKLPLLNWKPKQAASNALAGSTNPTRGAGPHRRTGSQRGRGAATHGAGPQSAPHGRSAAGTGSGRSGKSSTQPVVRQTNANLSSEHTSESTDHTSDSLQTSSIDPSSGTTRDSGMGDSVKPLCSIKSLQDINLDESLRLSIHQLDLHRIRSWPEGISSHIRSGHRVDDNVNEDDDGDAFTRSPVTRTRSCTWLIDDMFEFSSYHTVPVRRTQSCPNWPTIGEDMCDMNGSTSQEPTMDPAE